MNQSKSWEEFREACNYSNIPGENMIWADREGNIGWQAVGIAPIRNTHSGLVPVMGDGRYEWVDYLPIIEKPNIFNPKIFLQQQIKMLHQFLMISGMQLDFLGLILTEVIGLMTYYHLRRNYQCRI